VFLIHHLTVLNSRMMGLPLVALTVACTAQSAVAPQAPPRPPAPEQERPREDALAQSPHLLLGVPTDGDASNEIVLDHEHFVVSLSKETRLANWVAWRVRPDDVGDVPRSSSFRTDPQLPEALRVAVDEYAGTGWDRGHLCPAEDRSASVEASRRTFMTSNVVPQWPAMNRGSWARLEAHTRELASVGAAYVVAGTVWDATPSSLVSLPIPPRLFKVVVATGAGRADVVGTSETTIAVVVPNDASSQGRAWSEFTTSVDAIEAATGYDLLGALPDDVERTLEARGRP
jgi:endonuclease G, mitochondrial